MLGPPKNQNVNILSGHAPPVEICIFH